MPNLRITPTNSRRPHLAFYEIKSVLLDIFHYCLQCSHSLPVSRPDHLCLSISHREAICIFLLHLLAYTRYVSQT